MTVATDGSVAAIFDNVEVAHLIESQHNYRRSSDAKADKELQESIREKGILQPLLVRPLEGKRASKFEVVFGNRRLAAARAAGLLVVPCQVRELTDVEALEAAIVENVQRLDVHPIEEAEGFAELVKHHAYTVGDIAKKTGRSESWIRGRLKLAEVNPKVRKACIAGKITSGAAQAIARFVSFELQEEALADIEFEGTEISDAAVRDRLLEQFVRNMGHASWRLDDAELVAGAGACTACPKRTANDKQLFAELNKRDVCLDGDCWNKKLNAHRQHVVAAAQAGGAKVLEGKAAAKALRDKALRRADEREWATDDGKTVAAIAKKAKLEPTLVIEPGGEVVELYSRDEIRAALPKSAREQTGDGRGEAWRQREAKQRKEGEIRNRALFIAAEKAAAALTKLGGVHKLPETAQQRFWHALAQHFWADIQTMVARRRGLTGAGTRKHPATSRDQLEGWMKTAKSDELEACVLEELIYYCGGGHANFSFDAVLKPLGVNIASALAQAKRELAKKKAPEAKGAKTSKTSKTSKTGKAAKK